MEEDNFVLHGVVYEKPSPQHQVPNWFAKKYSEFSLQWTSFLSRETAVNMLRDNLVMDLEEGQAPLLDKQTFDSLLKSGAIQELNLSSVAMKKVAVGCAFESVPCVYYTGEHRIAAGEMICEIRGKWIFGKRASESFLAGVDVSHEFCWIHDMPLMESIFYSKTKNVGYFLLSSHLPNCFLRPFFDSKECNLRTMICAIREILPGEALTVAKVQKEDVRCGCGFFNCPCSFPSLPKSEPLFGDIGPTGKKGHDTATHGTGTEQEYCFEGLSNLKTPWQGHPPFSFCESHNGKCSPYRSMVGYAKDLKVESTGTESFPETKTASLHKKIPKKERESVLLHSGDFVEICGAITTKKKKSHVGRILFFIHCSVAKKSKVCIQIFSRECNFLLPKDPKEIFQTAQYHYFLTHECIRRKLNVRFTTSNSFDPLSFDEIDYYCHRTLGIPSLWPLQTPIPQDEILIKQMEEILLGWERIGHAVSVKSPKSSPTNSSDTLLSWSALLKEAESRSCDVSSTSADSNLIVCDSKETQELDLVSRNLSGRIALLSDEQVLETLKTFSETERKSLSRFAVLCSKAFETT